MEKRLRILETTVQAYGRRHDDCEKDRKEMSAALEEMRQWRETIQDATEVSRKLVEVGENLLIATRWIGIGAKWVITIGAAFAMFFGLFKWLVKAV